MGSWRLFRSAVVPVESPSCQRHPQLAWTSTNSRVEPSICSREDGTRDRACFPSKISARERPKGFLLSLRHPDEKTDRHVGGEARQGIGPDTCLASGSHSGHQAAAVRARGGSTGRNAFTALREPPAWLQCGEGII